VVERYAEWIKYIENPHQSVQLLAIKGSGANIQYIKNPTEALQLLAVKQKGAYFKYIKKPYPSVKNHPNVIAYKECKNDKVYSYSGSVGTFNQGGTISRVCE